MTWDLGAVGLLALLGMAVVFGAFAGAVFWGHGPWRVGAVATVAGFVVGLLVSEVWFGWATAEELQPNIDGLSFDEVLVALFVSAVIVLLARWLVGRGGRHPEAPRRTQGHPA
jgi:Na+/proline symporter